MWFHVSLCYFRKCIIGCIARYIVPTRKIEREKEDFLKNLTLFCHFVLCNCPVVAGVECLLFHFICKHNNVTQPSSSSMCTPFLHHLTDLER